MSYNLLSPLRVIESAAFIAAPLAGLLLAQYGADVIRVDTIGGGIDYGRLPRMPQKNGLGRSFYWTALNKGKRSIAVDVRRPEGRELIQHLATAPGPDSGVLLTNLGTPWLSHGVLAALRHDIITCTIQGNGDGSPAVDYTINSATGYPMVTGSGQQRPVNHVLPAWDVTCAHHAAFLVAAAVGQRQHAREGREICLALSDIAFSTLSHLGVLAETEVLKQERPSIDNYLYGAFGRDFLTLDGHRLMVVAISAGQWANLVRACSLADQVAHIEKTTGLDLADEAQRFTARELIAQVLETWFAVRIRSDIEALFKAERVLFGPYQTVMELLENDPRVSLSNPVFERLETPGIGSHLSADAAARISGLERSSSRPAPLLGTHTDEILHEVLGFSGAAIGKLHDAGIVAGPERDPTQTV